MTAPSSGLRRSLLPALMLLFSAAVVFVILEPRLLLTANTPAGGDMGAHVYAPAYLRDVLLPQGKVHGWSNDWFAGFPLFYFYFPLPSLVIVALDLILPYGVAFKLVTVAGLLAMPPAAYVLARALKLSRSASAIAGAGTVAFVFMESFSIYGGNVASTLAGEFSYSWSFALGLVYFALLIRTIEGERRLGPWAAVTFAAAALCHILTIVMLIAGTPFLLGRKGAVRTVLPVWVVSGAVTAFWSLPLLLRLRYSTDMAWTPLSRLEEILPVELWMLLPVAVFGGVVAVRRSWGALGVAAMTLIPLLYFPLPNLLPDLFPTVFTDPRWKLWNGRLLPYWYFGVTFFASIGVAVGVGALVRRLPERVSAWWARAALAALTAAAVLLVATRPEAPTWAPWAVAAAGAASFAGSLAWSRPVTVNAIAGWVAVAAIVFGSLAGLSFINGWARWNYSGYEGKAAWPEYSALMGELDSIPQGRTMWEYSKEQDKYGTTMALMLIPYWTGPEHASMEGLFFESSLTVPFHFLMQSEMSKAGSQPVPGLRYRPFDFERGIPHMDVYGVRYYISYTPEARDKAHADGRLTEIATSGPFTIFELENASLVEPASFQPAVYDGPEFAEFALEWFDDVSLFDRWVAADGPAEWPRVSEVGELSNLGELTPAGAVSNVEIGDDAISFDTTAIGVPHLVKVSYFPNWKVTGADGPFRVTPSLMLVVPTESHVDLKFGRTWVEMVGVGSTLVALAGLFVWWRRTRSPASLAAEQQPAEAEGVASELPEHSGA